ncbi:5-carboxymethyl-2-hydroxymuconate isomerase [Ekhidna lutea]|uniref:5-carboxymethyl-2-hydroxymuconate isomerase n=1 Tax=Ekhidna lutea TaxID=447679 RepID=A0A239LAZ9_EKHLU|nr:5-carboxymethyl-2-hydroxymuconate Delta-isomerase [Ekhidna lutea]SNT27806.1 5-carboxymethyl-2-hydroxymuconate isomerase [Ekhidna lutea]
MPHFIIHTNTKAIQSVDAQTILKTVHKQAVSSGLFDENDIKVRLVPFEKSLVAGKPDNDFIHVFGYIMGGRSTAQKSKLSEAIVKKLDELLNTENIAMNVYDFEPQTYFHRKMI